MNVVHSKHNTLLRPPRSTDGAALHRLIRSCPPLDENSMYCNLLQCTHFSGTSVVAEASGELVGAISAYLVPRRENTLFVWQVAVAEAARGQGLGRRMLNHIVARPQCVKTTHMETTVTEDNAASWKMFEGFAQQYGCDIQRRALFDGSTHFQGEHQTEVLARIGPLPEASHRQPATHKSEQLGAQSA